MGKFSMFKKTKLTLGNAHEEGAMKNVLRTMLMLGAVLVQFVVRAGAEANDLICDFSNLQGVEDGDDDWHPTRSPVGCDSSHGVLTDGNWKRSRRCRRCFKPMRPRRTVAEPRFRKRYNVFFRLRLQPMSNALRGQDAEACLNLFWNQAKDATQTYTRFPTGAMTSPALYPLG
jgi:hypothetical protein